MIRRKWIFWTAIIILLLLIGAVVLSVWYVDSRLKIINRPTLVEYEPTPMEIEAILRPSETVIEMREETEAEKTGEIINILLIGQDSRAGEEAQLADSIMMCTLNKDEKRITVTSFLRDLYVQIPNYRGYGGGKNRINVNYALGFARAGELGGMEMTAQCIEENFGIKADGVVVVGFDAFVKVVEAIGGIEVELDEAEAAYLNKTTEHDYTAGMNQIDSWDVLTYVRMRHSSPRDNDFYRTARQRKALESLVAKCKGLKLKEMDTILQSTLPLLTTNLSNEQIIVYGIQMLPILNEIEFESRQCPADGTYRGEMVDIMGVKSGVLIPDLQKNRELLLDAAQTE